MSESDRVQRWREAKRQQGLKACTVWLTPEEELRLKDLAARQRCSPSALIQEALAQYQPGSLPNISNDTDIALLREMIRGEIGALQAASAPATASVTDTQQIRTLIQEELAHVPPVAALVAATVTDTVAETLPALVRAIVEDLALEALGMPITDTDNSYVTDAEIHGKAPEAPHVDIAATNSNVTETATPTAPPTRPASKRPAATVPASAQNGTTAQPPGPRRGGRTSTVRQPILDLVRAHPEGLTAVQIKVHLGIDKTIGDTLAGMVRNQLLTKQGSGAQVRYRAARPSESPERLPRPSPQPRRRIQH